MSPHFPKASHIHSPAEGATNQKIPNDPQPQLQLSKPGKDT